MDGGKPLVWVHPRGDCLIGACLKHSPERQKWPGLLLVLIERGMEQLLAGCISATTDKLTRTNVVDAKSPDVGSGKGQAGRASRKPVRDIHITA